ncbi:MAG: hypothetical protein PVG60_01145, partial [Desulfarculaceae bacterium]
IIRHLLNGMLEVDDGLTYALYSCLLCKRCENVCKSKGQNIDICRVIQLGRMHLAPQYLKGGGRDT